MGDGESGMAKGMCVISRDGKLFLQIPMRDNHDLNLIMNFRIGIFYKKKRLYRLKLFRRIEA